MKLPAPSRRPQAVLLVSLVDVLFVLLLFFLMAATGKTATLLPVELGAVATTAAAPVLHVGAGGDLRLNGASVTIEQLRGTAAVQLEFDRDVELRALMPVLEALRAAGITPALAAT